MMGEGKLATGTNSHLFGSNLSKKNDKVSRAGISKISQGLRLLSTPDLKREALARGLQTNNAKRDIVKILAPLMYNELCTSEYLEDRATASIAAKTTRTSKQKSQG